MSNLIPFDYHGHEVRTVSVNGDPWFVAKDVCDVLELENSRMAIDRLDDDEKGVSLTDTLGGKQAVSVISESGLYSLTLGSRKPQAKPFKRWVTHEVVPAIRKTGGYVSNDDAFISTYLPFADDATKSMFRATLETVRRQNTKIEADKPKVLFADSVSASHTSILVGEMAKILKQNGVEIGEKRFFQWLRDNGYIITRSGTDHNMPTQKSMERGLFEIKETSITHSSGTVTVSKTPKITGKGQAYFVDKFLN